MKNDIKKVLCLTAFIIGDIGIFVALVIFANSFKEYKTDEIGETTTSAYELITESTTYQQTRAIDSKSTSPLVNWMRKQIKNVREK